MQLPDGTIEGNVKVVNDWAIRNLHVRLDALEIVDVWHLLSTNNQYRPVLPTIKRLDRLVELVTYRFFVDVSDFAEDRVFTWAQFHRDYVLKNSALVFADDVVDADDINLKLDSFSPLTDYPFDAGKVEPIRFRTSQALDLLVVLFNSQLDADRKPL